MACVVASGKRQYRRISGVARALNPPSSRRHMRSVDSANLAPISSSEHARLTSRAAAFSVAAAVLLIVLKAGAWLASSSVAMLASLADSTLDLLAALLTYFAVRYAAAPPDREHRFGHGKAEAFAGLVQAGLVLISAGLIAVEAIPRLFVGPPMANGLASLAVMVVSIALTATLVGAQSHAIARTGSLATRADRIHYLGDLGANFAVMIGIGAGYYFGWTWADGAAALLVAGWLCAGALYVARQSGDHLLDRELPDAQRQRIRDLAESDPRITSVHDLRTRTSGAYTHIQFHVDLPATMTLEEAHHLIVEAEARIGAEFPTADIIIHPDPKGRAEPHGHEDFARAQHR